MEGRSACFPSGSETLSPPCIAFEILAYSVTPAARYDSAPSSGGVFLDSPRTECVCGGAPWVRKDF